MKKLLFIFLILMVASTPVLAAPDLYSGEVAVSGQSIAERNDAVPLALIQVLQKLSGQREMPVSPALDEALQNAHKALLSFRYKKVKRLSPEGADIEELHLLARFMPSEVDQILRRAALPRWQSDRPAVQVWAVIDDGQTRTLNPLEYQYAWQAMQRVAASRGLPLSWPELDAEEAQLIDMRLVWGGFTDYLVEWGAPADGVLIIAARREGARWVLRWSLASGERHWNWHNGDQELMFALADGIHHAVDQIAAANAIAATDLGHWSIDVTVVGLNSGNDYTRCLAYLQNQDLITAVEVLAAEPGRAHFRLQLNAMPRYLADAFKRAAVLLPLGADGSFEYRYLR